MQRAIIIILAVLVSLPVIFKSRVSGVISAPAAFSVVSSATATVRLSGDVRHSGIYKFSANMLTVDAINMAVVSGPVTRFEPVETGACHVVNGADIQLKIRPDGTGIISVGSMPSSARMVLGVPLDINSMSEADFDRLPGIGAVIAKRIVEYRQNNGGKMRLEELLSVEGIGKTKYQRISKYF